MSSARSGTRGPRLGSATVVMQQNGSTKGRPHLTAVNVRVRHHRPRQVRGPRPLEHANPTSPRHGVCKWRISKQRSTSSLGMGDGRVLFDTNTCATTRLPLPKRLVRHDHRFTRSSPWVEQQLNDRLTMWSEPSRRKDCIQPVSRANPGLYCSSNVSDLFLNHGHLRDHADLGPVDQDTLSARDSPRGAGIAAWQKESESPGHSSPLAEHVLLPGEGVSFPALYRLEWTSEEGPQPLGTNWGGGGGSQPSTTGTQGFPQYVTAGPDVSLSGYNLFGYEADDLQGAIQWA